MIPISGQGEVVAAGRAFLPSVLLLEERCFPKGWQYDDGAEYYGWALEHPEHINLFWMLEGVVAGYVLARPHNRLVGDLAPADQEFCEQELPFYYVETIQIDPCFQGRGGARMLLEAVCAEALRRGVGHGSIHAQVANGFNQKCKHILADRLLRARWITSWEYAGGKECEYMEWRCDNRE